MNKEGKQIYFQRYGYAKTPLIKRDFAAPIAVVVPCYNEPDLPKTLRSLYSCTVPHLLIDFYLVINYSESEEQGIIDNCLLNYEDACSWKMKFEAKGYRLHVLLAAGLPRKHAGVGLARKIGMDEAVFHQTAPEALIVNLDADCTVSENYLVALADFYNDKKKVPGCSLYFEHPLNTPGIIEYELFLRYYVAAQNYAGFPYAFQTVGSSMAVRNFAYLKVGGMNRRKAGEDFYFLHKIIAMGNFQELDTLAVFPSDRYSDRVPFGTGKALLDYKSGANISCYPFRIFEELKKLLTRLPEFYEKKEVSIKGLEELLAQFLIVHDFQDAVQKLLSNSKSYSTFEKHFFHWFDAFKLMKYGNNVLSKLENQPDVTEESSALLTSLGIEVVKKSPKELLELYRRLKVNV